MGKVATVSSVHYSSKSPEYYTPDWILEAVINVMGAIDLDPCSDPGKRVPAKLHYTRVDNGLKCGWFGRVFLNPPYGREIGKWMGKLAHHYTLGDVTEAIALIPARTDTKWFGFIKGYPICFLRGRVRFVGAAGNAPFPSALVYLGDKPIRFWDEFRAAGVMYKPITIKNI